ncbi:Methyltransferase [Psidium guajava]|nr:Methyltransferase [Psidium guajava]
MHSRIGGYQIARISTYPKEKEEQTSWTIHFQRVRYELNFTGSKFASAEAEVVPPPKKPKTQQPRKNKKQNTERDLLGRLAHSTTQHRTRTGFSIYNRRTPDAAAKSVPEMTKSSEDYLAESRIHDDSLAHADCKTPIAIAPREVPPAPTSPLSLSLSRDGEVRELEV